MEFLTLNNGIQIPQLGIGTYRLNDPDISEQAVLEALRDGYRLVDTAEIYHNERYIGSALRECGLPRESLFVTTKIWPAHYRGDRPRRALEHSLKRLGSDYVDLLLLHQYFGDWKNAWKQLERMQEEGLARSIGVCNFYTVRSIAEFDSFAHVAPAVDQVECHPLIQHGALQHYLEGVGIRLMAWYPLGHGNTLLLEQPVLMELSRQYRKSVPQIILRWHIQKGHIVIPKSTNPRHIKADINVFNFTLTEEEMKMIDGLNMGRSLLRRWEHLEKIKYCILR
ncbi:MAG: aldo/keto reductase [Butyrivibrio sp.]|nr:aldo/keto reductase [Butyrivibrio sp.]